MLRRAAERISRVAVKPATSGVVMIVGKAMWRRQLEFAL